MRSSSRNCVINSISGRKHFRENSVAELSELRYLFNIGRAHFEEEQNM